MHSTLTFEDAFHRGGGRGCKNIYLPFSPKRLQKWAPLWKEKKNFSDLPENESQKASHKSEPTADPSCSLHQILPAPRWRGKNVRLSAPREAQFHLSCSFDLVLRSHFRLKLLPLDTVSPIPFPPPSTPFSFQAKHSIRFPHDLPTGHMLGW